MHHFESEDEPGQTAWYEGEIVAYIGDKGDEDENGELLNFDVYYDVDDETVSQSLSIEDYNAQRTASVARWYVVKY